MDHDKRVVIYGCGGHSRSVTDIILLNDPATDLIYVDDNAREGENLFGFDVISKISLDDYMYFFAIGDNAKRQKKLEELGDANLISVISRKSHVGIGAEVKKGCFIGNYCHVGPQAVIGMNTILNTAAIIEHEVVIGNGSHIGPNATISGRCRIGEQVFVGVGATVMDHINICAKVIIGAGATVVNNITEPGVYVGTPAKKIR